MKIKIEKDLWLPLSLMVVAIVVVCVTLCLTDVSYHASYDFAVGQQWTYDKVVATRSFDAEYTPPASDSIREHVIATFVPKATVNDDVLPAVLAAHRNLSPALRAAVVAQYRVGIADDNLSQAMAAGDITMVDVLDDAGVYAHVDTTALLKARDAIQRLADGYNITLDVAAALARPNVSIDTVNSTRLLDNAIDNALFIKQVAEGDVIVDNGDVVTPVLYHVLHSYYDDRRAEFEQLSTARHQVLAGKVALIALLMITFFIYLYTQQPQYLGQTKKLIFMLLLLSLAMGLGLFAITHAHNYRYVIPLVMIPIVIAVFFDSRTAFAAHMVLVLVTALVVGDRAEYIMMQLVAGSVGICSMNELTRRSQIVRCAANVFVAYLLMYTAIVMMRGGDMTEVFSRRVFSAPDHLDFEWTVVKYFAVNCVTLSFSSVAIFLVEWLFGFTSNATLVELTDINTPLMRRLSETCQGTFQHSLQVATLASEAALKLGANEKMVRAGALYHDIGKITNPRFFTENQRGVNPHDALVPEQSAQIVIAHVTEGAKMAREAGLPQVIIDMILQHHGHGMAKFFYAKACKAKPGEDVSKEPYTYPGPNPQTKEAAILMMADACEAAVKSMTDQNDRAIKEMVCRVIDGQMADGLLSEAPITLREISEVKNIFTERLRSFAVARVSYPTEATKPAAEAPKPADS